MKNLKKINFDAERFNKYVEYWEYLSGFFEKELKSEDLADLMKYKLETLTYFMSCDKEIMIYLNRYDLRYKFHIIKFIRKKKLKELFN